MRLILEGPDCAGKSTMAKELAERLRLDVIKSTYYGPKNISAYRERLACQDVVIDRCWISEVIYSKYFGRPPIVDDFTDRMLCDICIKQNIPIVVMLPPIDVIIQRMIERGDDFYSVVAPNVHAIYKDYEDYCAARPFIHVFRDYNPSKMVDFCSKTRLKDDFMQVKINVLDHKSVGRIPSRKHYNDAGADVYTCKYVSILPHETKMIPLGFAIEVPDGYMACIFPRSSMALRGLVCEIPPIDSGYRGEVFAIVSNLTDYAKNIQEGTRIGQIVVMPCIICDFVTKFGDERGTGAFGSTGEK